MAAGLGQGAEAAPQTEQDAQDTLPAPHTLQEMQSRSPSQVSASFDCGKNRCFASCSAVIRLGLLFLKLRIPCLKAALVCAAGHTVSERRTH